MDFESILEEILLGRGQGNLKLKPKQKEGLQAIVFLIVGATAESLKQALRLNQETSAIFFTQSREKCS